MPFSWLDVILIVIMLYRNSAGHGAGFTARSSEFLLGRGGRRGALPDA